MSKKDYQAIARAIYSVRQGHPAFSQHFDGSTVSAADDLTAAFATVLSADNRLFDRARFVEACETGTTKGVK